MGGTLQNPVVAVGNQRAALGAYILNGVLYRLILYLSLNGMWISLNGLFIPSNDK